MLSYSNWETGTICYSETFESLSEGLQNALWEVGGVPNQHRSDRMSAAINNLVDTGEFTRAYKGLLRHYGLIGQKIQAGEAHENGDIEQRHYRFKQRGGVTAFSPGDDVYGMVGGVGGLPGTLAEFVAADVDLLARKPRNLSMREARAPTDGKIIYLPKCSSDEKRRSEKALIKKPHSIGRPRRAHRKAPRATP